MGGLLDESPVALLRLLEPPQQGVELLRHPVELVGAVVHRETPGERVGGHRADGLLEALHRAQGIARETIPGHEAEERREGRAHNQPQGKPFGVLIEPLGRAGNQHGDGRSVRTRGRQADRVFARSGDVGGQGGGECQCRRQRAGQCCRPGDRDARSPPS